MIDFFDELYDSSPCLISYLMGELNIELSSEFLLCFRRTEPDKSAPADDLYLRLDPRLDGLNRSFESVFASSVVSPLYSNGMSSSAFVLECRDLTGSIGLSDWVGVSYGVSFRVSSFYYAISFLLESKSDFRKEVVSNFGDSSL